MLPEAKTILVVGATGKQGGAVTHHLLAQGWKVRALVRDPRKPTARELLQRGVELVPGNLDQTETLSEALHGVYGIFSMQPDTLQNPATEITQGKRLVNAARAQGIQHFVYSSIGGADRNTNIPHFESKWQIEQYIRALNIPATILRPVFFMDNFHIMFGSAIQEGVLAWALPAERRLQMIAVADIGAFAALAFAQPQRFLGQALELAGDELSMLQIAEAFSRVLEKEVHYVEMSRTQGYSPEMVRYLDWLSTSGFRADIPALRAIYPELMTFERWLHVTGWGSKKVPRKEHSTARQHSSRR